MREGNFTELTQAYDFGYIRCENDVLNIIEKHKNNLSIEFIQAFEKIMNKYHSRDLQKYMQVDDNKIIDNLKEQLRERYVSRDFARRKEYRKQKDNNIK